MHDAPVIVQWIRALEYRSPLPPQRWVSTIRPRWASGDVLLARELRRLAAIVAIDVVGYSRLMGRNESATHALFKKHLAERVEPAITRHGGRRVKSTGDGALAEFG